MQSCDVVFYQIAHDFFEAARDGQVSQTALQDYLAKFHFDRYTGIDLGGESVGVIPTPEWKLEHFRNTPEEAVWEGRRHDEHDHRPGLRSRHALAGGRRLRRPSPPGKLG